MQKEKNLEETFELQQKRMTEIERKEEVLQLKLDSIIHELEKVSGMSTQEAKTEILNRVEAKLSKEIAGMIKNREQEAKDQAHTIANEILGMTLNRYAQDFVTERTVSVIHLPSDEMKGRIIGREGRNIRSLEQALGVDLIIDDTPEVITVSCFDPIRRETAKRTLEILLKDGRIQPSRIESHHGDAEIKYVTSHLVIAADTLSAARPGARSETLETYVKRLEQLEVICKSYEGVAQSYAMQSGREVRIMVVPDKIDDASALKLARDIKDRIEAEMTYPGQIKVSVIREYRAIETAK